MEKARLTILIPNFNRPAALERLLKTLFGSIDRAQVGDQVCVLVVDDHSTIDVRSAIAPFLSKREFQFRAQPVKCGNAEVAFLSGVQLVETEYVWLLGNDDIVSADAVGRVLSLVGRNRFGFVLLNPRLIKQSTKHFSPIQSSSASVIYDTGHDLFSDFGFVTSTTTFPCLVCKTRPLAEFHRKWRLDKFATVYSHSFSLYGAFREEPSMFFGPNLVGFTLNERHDEQEKLEAQSPGTKFHHQSLGLARLIKATAEICEQPISFFGSAAEDEIDKDGMFVSPTLLAYFLMHFLLEQFIREIENATARYSRAGFRYFSPGDICEMREVVRRFEEDRLIQLLEVSISIHSALTVSPEWKVEYLRREQRRLREEAVIAYRRASSKVAPGAPVKLHVPNFATSALRGRMGDLGATDQPLLSAAGMARAATGVWGAHTVELP